MATVVELQRKIGRITGRVGDTNFPTDSLDGLNEGLKELLSRHNIRGVITSTTLTEIEGAVSTTIPSTINPKSIMSIRASKSTNDFYPVRLKTKTYLDRVFANRTDPEKNVELSVMAREGSVLYFNGPLNDSYTILLELMADATLLVAASSSPIPNYDQALIHYSSYWIYSILEQEQQANRQLNLYERARQIASESESKDQATVFKYGMRPLLPRHGSILKPSFLDSDLETL